MSLLVDHLNEAAECIEAAIEDALETPSFTDMEQLPDVEAAVRAAQRVLQSLGNLRNIILADSGGRARIVRGRCHGGD